MFLSIHFFHTNQYISILAIATTIFINYKIKHKIYFLLVGLILGYIACIIPHNQEQRGTISYIGNHCVFLKNKGMFKINHKILKNKNLNIGNTISFIQHHNNIVKIIDKSENSLWTDHFSKQREKIKKFLMKNKNFDFWIAIILGDKSYISKSNINNLIDSNIYHIIIISGFHFTLLYNLIYYIIIFFTAKSKKINYFCTIYYSHDIIPHTIACILCSYYFMVSLFSVTSIRAILMILFKKSNYSSKVTLLLLFNLFLLYDYKLAYHMGFLLSYTITYLLLTKRSNVDICLWSMPITNNSNPLSVINNMVGTTIIGLILPICLLSIVIQSIEILNLCDPLINILNKHLYNNNILSIHKRETNYITIASHLFFLQTNKKYYLYISCMIFFILNITSI